MDRTDLQRLSREELIELVLSLQRPDKTSRTSPPRAVVHWRGTCKPKSTGPEASF
jgi:hypothetical protein